MKILASNSIQRNVNRTLKLTNKNDWYIRTVLSDFRVPLAENVFKRAVASYREAKEEAIRLKMKQLAD